MAYEIALEDEVAIFEDATTLARLIKDKSIEPIIREFLMTAHLRGQKNALLFAIQHRK